MVSVSWHGCDLDYCLAKTVEKKDIISFYFWICIFLRQELAQASLKLVGCVILLH